MFGEMFLTLIKNILLNHFSYKRNYHSHNVSNFEHVAVSWELAYCKALLWKFLQVLGLLMKPSLPYRFVCKFH